MNYLSTAPVHKLVDKLQFFFVSLRQTGIQHEKILQKDMDWRRGPRHPHRGRLLLKQEH